MSFGYVYCLTNDYMPNICKIGYTNKTSHDRAHILSKNTSCPDKFNVIFDIKVKDPQKYEKRIHKKLKKFRINKNREFFKCEPFKIIEYFNKNVLIKNKMEEDDFTNNYMTIYKPEIKKQYKYLYCVYNVINLFKYIYFIITHYIY
jgi:hypothetical protein